MGCEFADEGGEGAVGGIAAGEQSQDRHDVLGVALPVEVELEGAVVEEEIACVVERCAVLREQVGNSARPRALAPTTSPSRPSATAGTSDIASRSCAAGCGRCGPGLTRGVLAPSEAARVRLNRCSVSASFKCSARASDRSTLSDTPRRFPRSIRV